MSTSQIFRPEMPFWPDKPFLSDMAIWQEITFRPEMAMSQNWTNQVLIPSPMFLFCFAHGKFTLISLNSALPALVSLIQNLVETFLKTAKKCHIGKNSITKTLKPWFYVTEVCRTKFNNIFHWQIVFQVFFAFKYQNMTKNLSSYQFGSNDIFFDTAVKKPITF